MNAVTPNTENSTITDAEECVTEHIAIDKNIIRSKNEITSIILRNNKYLKPKPIFFFTVYRLRGVVVFGNVTQIRECSSTVKNQPNL